MTFRNIPSGQSIRLVMLGCGAITAKHSKWLKKQKGLTLSFASRSEEKALLYAKKFQGVHHYASYEAAIQSAETDVVFVATPPDSHLTLTLQAIRAGKHVIVEKPPFFKSTDFDLVEEERKKTGVQVMIAENYFYKPLRKKLKEVLQSGLIGEIKFMYFNATKTQRNDDWREAGEVAGGGALFEGGIHWINFISNLGMEVQSVTGFQPGKPGLSPKSPERSMQVVTKYVDGPVGTLLYSWEISALINGLRISRIYGTKGSVTFESNGIFLFIRGRKWRFLFPGFADIGGTKGMFKDFFRALRNGEEPEFSLAMAKRDLDFIEKAYQSAG